MQESNPGPLDHSCCDCFSISKLLEYQLLKLPPIKTALFWAIEKKIKCQIRTSFPQMIRSNSLPLDYENMADSFFKGVLPFLVVSASWNQCYKLDASPLQGSVGLQVAALVPDIDCCILIWKKEERFFAAKTTYLSSEINSTTNQCGYIRWNLIMMQ